MSHELNTDNTVSVIAYSLHEFAYELCELGAKGFTVSLENDKLPTGGFTSYYTAILVPRHGYRIDIEGNHVNLPDSTPETSTETPLKAPTSDVSTPKATPVATEPKTARTAAKKAT
jgi:hypothetical protein